MIEYLCYRCGYNTNKKSNINNHLNRKKICKPLLGDVSIEDIKNHYGLEIIENTINNSKITPNNSKITPNNSKITPKSVHITPKSLQNTPNSCNFDNSKPTCKYCFRTYIRKDNLTKHLKICKKKIEVETLKINQEEQIEQMKLEIEELKNFKIQTQNNTNNTNNSHNSHNNSHNKINNSKNIIINNYGDENIKHLKYKDYVDILSSKYMCVPNLIEKIHFDSEHPENKNIKYTNKKFPLLKIMKDNKWQFVNKKNELLNLIDDKCFLLKEKYYKILEKKNINYLKIKKKK